LAEEEAFLQQQSEQAVGIIDRAGDSLAEDTTRGINTTVLAPLPPILLLLNRLLRHLIILPAASPRSAPHLSKRRRVRIQLLQHHSFTKQVF